MKIEIESLDEACDVAFKTISYLIRENQQLHHCIDSCTCRRCMAYRKIVEGAKLLSEEITKRNYS